MNDQEIDAFIEEVEEEKKKIAKCGWMVQDDALIVRAINIIKDLRAWIRDHERSIVKPEKQETKK